MSAYKYCFDGCCILVSGASSGIGRAIAISLLQNGAKVALLGRREEQLKETAQLSGVADRAKICMLDLNQLDDIAPVVSQLSIQLGRFHGLCHCAGVVQTLPLAASKPNRVSAMFSINFMAGLELARAITRRGVFAEAGGSILWIASIYAHVGAPGQIGYCASKGAVTAALRSMALELADRKIRVNCLSPGMVRTEMTDLSGSRMTEEQWARIAALHPLGVGEAQDIAHAAMFMLDPNNRWITGADLVIDGGYTLQ